MSGLSNSLMRFANELMPAGDRDWARAMQSEMAAIEGRGARLIFAAGCVSTAFHLFSHTRSGASRIGRSLLVVAVVCLTFYGMWMSHRIAEPEFARLAFVLFGSYGVAAAFCVMSLRAMQRYCTVGIVVGTLTLGIISLTHVSTPTLPTNVLSALTLEATGTFCALWIAGWFLGLLTPNTTEV